MKNRIIILMTLFFLGGCTAADIQRTMDILNSTNELTTGEVASGLKEALNVGIGKGSDRLSATDGYFKSVYKILLPEEAREVTEKLKVIPGFDKVEDEILKRINRGAEDAAKKAKPIFVGAIKQMTFTDAMDILMGADNAATSYLNRTTYDKLYAEFNPVILESLNKFKAQEYWAEAVNKYNQIPFVNKVNPDLGDYVTQEALNGLFGMVEKEERNIRKNVSARTSDLLKKVFAKQDNK